MINENYSPTLIGAPRARACDVREAVDIALAAQPQLEGRELALYVQAHLSGTPPAAMRALLSDEDLARIENFVGDAYR